MKKVVRLEDGKKVLLPVGEAKGHARMLISNELTGACNYSLQVSEILPGGVSRTHNHDVEHGFFILSGEGVMTLSGEEYPIGPNMAVHVPPGKDHSVKNVGTKPLQYVVIYAPPVS